MSHSDPYGITIMLYAIQDALTTTPKIINQHVTISNRVTSLAPHTTS
jgi:hypothetical protein